MGLNFYSKRVHALFIRGIRLLNNIIADGKCQIKIGQMCPIDFKFSRLLVDIKGRD
jgi:hypothetical protein